MNETSLVSRRRMIQLGITTGVAIAMIGANVALAPAKGLKVFSDHDVTTLRAIAEVMFPPGSFPVDGLTANVAERVDEVANELFLPVHRVGFRSVLFALESGTLMSRGAPFSVLSADERTEVLNVWLTPSIHTRRIAADSLRAILGMAFFGHPEVLSSIGWYTICSKQK